MHFSPRSLQDVQHRLHESEERVFVDVQLHLLRQLCDLVDPSQDITCQVSVTERRAFIIRRCWTRDDLTSDTGPASNGTPQEPAMKGFEVLRRRHNRRRSRLNLDLHEAVEVQSGPEDGGEHEQNSLEDLAPTKPSGAAWLVSESTSRTTFMIASESGIMATENIIRDLSMPSP